MKTTNFLVVILLTCSSLSPSAPKKSDSLSYTYRQATLDDFEQLLHLINEKSSKEENLVTLPLKYRAGSLKSVLEKGRLFVCCKEKEIVGYKKAFVLDDPQEQAATLKEELCFEASPVAHHSFSIPDYSPLSLSLEKMKELFSSPTTYIYNGADFTDHPHRGKGINSSLTKHALHALAPHVATNIRDSNSNYLAIVYGLTQANAGTENDVLGGRTRSIVQEFVPFAAQQAHVLHTSSPSHLLAARYPAFKPSFDPDAEECIPSATQVPGYGCILSYPLTAPLFHESNAS
jgi:hypothetical protein